MPIVFAGPMKRHPAGGREFVQPIDLLHISAHLDDEHAAIAIERARNGLENIGLGDDKLEVVARLELDRLRFVCGRLRLDWRLWGKLRGGLCGAGGLGEKERRDEEEENAGGHDEKTEIPASCRYFMWSLKVIPLNCSPTTLSPSFTCTPQPANFAPVPSTFVTFGAPFPPFPPPPPAPPLPPFC